GVLSTKATWSWQPTGPKISPKLIQPTSSRETRRRTGMIPFVPLLGSLAEKHPLGTGERRAHDDLTPRRPPTAGEDPSLACNDSERGSEHPRNQVSFGWGVFKK